MGRIVGGFATAHIMMSRGSAGDKGERVFAGMKEIGRRIRALSPDLVVIISSDHLYNYDLAIQAPFAIATDAQHQPFGDMSLPTDLLPGAADFASGFVGFAAEHDADLVRLQDYRPDHGVTLPALIIDPDRQTPIVPFIINTAMDPAPRLARAWRYGELLADYVQAARPADERVVVVGTGGLSHWLAVADMGRVNPAFDHAVIDAINSGKGKSLTAWTSDYVLEHGGNGGLEILNWVMMAATLPGQRGETIYYEEIPEWVTGMGGIALVPTSDMPETNA
jgi:aromatic ring-opening dioxygenase catalytic subunit (LigB family)